MRRETDALGIEPEVDAFIFEDRLYCVRNVFVLARDQTWTFLHNGHVGPEAPVHLGELEPDITATHDNQMRREEIDVHDCRICQVVIWSMPGIGGTLARPPTLIKI